MEGLLEVIGFKELFTRGEISGQFDYDMFEDKTIMRFKSLIDAANFGIRFLKNYLIPKYGIEQAKKFPMDRSEPYQKFKSLEEGSIKMGEAIGTIPRDPKKETWLVIPRDRYFEVQEYLDSLTDH